MDFGPRAPRRVRHENGLRLARVVFVEPVTPLMRRITFHAPEFTNFSSAAADDHVKLFFPHGAAPVLPVPGPEGLQFPPGAERPPSRDYTPRRFDRRACELTIEFVLHGHGPAASWAKRAKPGDLLAIGGPRGSQIIPEDYAAYLLAGDETALPAIARRLEEMPPGTPAAVLIEVANRQEQRELATAAHAEITWLFRDGKPAGRSGLLEAALRNLTLPGRDTHAWIACEIEEARRMRDYLMADEGLARSQIKAAGYWKLGAAGAHDKLD